MVKIADPGKVVGIDPEEKLLVKSYEEAGIKLSELVGMPRIEYAGGPNFSAETASKTLDPQGSAKALRASLVNSGKVDEELIYAARREWEVWPNHPHRLRMRTGLMADGIA